MTFFLESSKMSLEHFLAQKESLAFLRVWRKEKDLGEKTNHFKIILSFLPKYQMPRCYCGKKKSVFHNLLSGNCACPFTRAKEDVVQGGQWQTHSKQTALPSEETVLLRPQWLQHPFSPELCALSEKSALISSNYRVDDGWWCHATKHCVMCSQQNIWAMAPISTQKTSRIRSVPLSVFVDWPLLSCLMSVHFALTISRVRPFPSS